MERISQDKYSSEIFVVNTNNKTFFWKFKENRTYRQRKRKTDEGEKKKKFQRLEKRVIQMWFRGVFYHTNNLYGPAYIYM